MKIADLKQPYKRMAEYLVTQNCIQEASDGIYNFYKKGDIMDLFCNAIDKGYNPPITTKIKQNFPPDFDFSDMDIDITEGETIYSIGDYITRVNPKYYFTQLAKEGKIDRLPDTCEFSEPVELEVWDNDYKQKEDAISYKILGKFKGKYINNYEEFWDFAQLPTPKIDFSQFKSGDVVEVETISVGYMYGYIREVESDKLLLSLGYMSDVLRTIRKEKIKSITKIK